jgi:hypothetical protein
MRHRTFLRATALFTVLAGGAFTVLAYDWGDPGTRSTVGPVTATITALNYDESGAAVNGFLVGTNTLLTFNKNVCGGIGTLGKVGDSVTYSGTAETFTSGFVEVDVTSYTDGTITYPPTTTSTKPSAYPLTPGTITQLNYGLENGSIDGFVFTPTTGPKVFVDVGTPSATLAPLLKVGTAVSVVGTLEGPQMCAPAGTISEVDASSLTIGTTSYHIDGNR